MTLSISRCMTYISLIVVTIWVAYVHYLEGVSYCSHYYVVFGIRPRHSLVTREFLPR